MSDHHPHSRHRAHQEGRETGGIEANIVTNDTRAPSEADRCPNCNAGTLRPSQRKPKDWLRALIGLKPYRCSRCNKRMYRR